MLLFDLSMWSVNVNYDLLSQRTSSGFIRASSSRQTDRLFETHWAETRNRNLLRGAFHVWDPESDPLEQAKYFFSIVSGTGELGELPPVLDIEKRDSGVDVRRFAEETGRT